MFAVQNSDMHGRGREWNFCTFERAGASYKKEMTYKHLSGLFIEAVNFIFLVKVTRPRINILQEILINLL